MSQIKKSLLGLLALLVVAGAVGGIALWTQKDEAAKTEAKEKSEKLFDFDKAHARSLRLEKDGKLVAALAKDEKGWKLDQPIKAEADDSAVDSLLSSMSSLKQKKDLADEKDLKAYGLDAPRLAVMVKLDDGKEQGLLLGVDNSFDNTLYVKKSGDATVRIVDGYNKNTFDKSLLDLRNKKVAHLDDSAEVKRVEVSGVKNPYVLEKDGANWKVGGAPADSGAADRVVSAVKQLRGTSVSTENGSIDKPKVTVKLSVTAGKDTFTRTVLIAQKDAKTYARRDDSPVVWEVDASVLKDLEKEPFDLQDKTLVHAERDQIRKFVFESPSGRLEVTRTKLTPPDGGFPDEKYEVVGHGPAKKWKMSSASYSMTSLRAAAFDGPVPKDLKKYGFDKTATLLGENDKVLARIRVGSEKDGKRYVLVDGVDKLARVEKGTVDDWPWNLPDALEPAPAAPDAGVQASKP